MQWLITPNFGNVYPILANAAVAPTHLKLFYSIGNHGNTNICIGTTFSLNVTFPSIESVRANPPTNVYCTRSPPHICSLILYPVTVATLDWICPWHWGRNWYNTPSARPALSPGNSPRTQHCQYCQHLWRNIHIKSTEQQHFLSWTAFTDRNSRNKSQFQLWRSSMSISIMHYFLSWKSQVLALSGPVFYIFPHWRKCITSELFFSRNILISVKISLQLMLQLSLYKTIASGCQHLLV